MSITMRLSLGMAIFAALFLASTGYVARSVFVTEINEIVEDSLAGAAQRMMPLVQGAVANYEEHHSDEHDSGESHDVLEVEDDFALFLDTGEGFLAFQVTGPDGAVILRSKDARGITFPPNPRAGFVETPDVLAYTEVDAQTGLVLTLIVPAMHRGEAVAEATRALAWPLTFLVPLMILGIFILVRLSLAPLG
jgi:two-component system OmpR family sensor kinase